MVTSKFKRRRKKLRRAKNRLREHARKARKHKTLPMRRHVCLRFRGGFTLRYSLEDAVTMPWDGETQATKEEAVVKLWEDEGAPTAGSA